MPWTASGRGPRVARAGGAGWRGVGGVGRVDGRRAAARRQNSRGARVAPPVHKPLCFFLCPPTTPQAMALEAETFRYVCVCWCLRRCCGRDVPLRVLSSARRSALSPFCSAAHARVDHLSPTSAHPAPSCPPNRIQQSAPCRVLPALCGGSIAAPRHTTPPSCPSPITCSPLLHLSPPLPPPRARACGQTDARCSSSVTPP